ncbi:MAG: murein hydrolase activator EnvC family protein [Candidatus Binatia bacterium]
MRKTGAAGAALFLILHLSLLSAASAAEIEGDLEGIKKKIEAEKHGMSKVRKQEGSVLQALEKIDGELENKTQRLKRISKRLEAYGADLKKKEEESKRIAAALNARKELLKKRLRALYKWSRGANFLILLNDSASPADLLRRRRYLERTLEHDQELIRHYAGESTRYESLKAEVMRKSQSLDKERRALLEVKEEIRSEGEKKRQLLASLRREKEARVRAIRELEQAASRLQKMLDEMSRKAALKPVPRGTGFEAMKGNLDYPVRGEVVEGFGKTKHPDFSAEFFRKGIDIEAPLGEAVKAVEGGNVIFADRFSGYGKMVIIDHGQRYYTVYAHLSEILKSAGQAVQKGDAIGQVGDSDSLRGARLYFEIRKDGKPLDPVSWLRKR